MSAGLTQPAGTQPSGTQISGFNQLPQAPLPSAVPAKPAQGHARSRFREYGLPLLLLTASIATTSANGARFMQNFLHGLPPVAQDSDLWPWGWLAAHPALFRTGWPFSTALLGILLIHELGHYFACRWHRIRATLPWVLPAPTLSGTAGAIIKIRTRIPSRNALMDVGIYGPLAGYVASLAAVALGFVLSVKAAPRAHRLFTNFLPILLFVMGTLYWVGWLLWGLFLMIPAMRHPRVPAETVLSRGRLALAVIGLGIFLMTFTPTPFHGNSLMHFFNLDPFSTAP